MRLTYEDCIQGRQRHVWGGGRALCTGDGAAALEAHLQELEVAAREHALAQRLVQAVRQAAQVAQHAAETAERQRAL